ncbi:MAG: hypothetical protein O3A46_01110 [Candidatus Poribacteria bacterium]|nr:hypothetical protein [Candidatus Poribacteria bacterium]
MPRLRHATTLIVLSLIVSTTASAAFQDTFGGARSLAIGGAAVATADDLDSLVVNPAGLINLRHGDHRQLVSATYGGLFLGLDDGNRLSQSYVGYATASGDKTALGVAWKRFAAGALYSEDRVSVGVARKVRFAQPEEETEERLALGVKIDLLDWNAAPTVGASGNIVEDLSGSARLDLTIGAIFRLSVSEGVVVPLGVALHHLNTPNVASSESQVAEDVPTQVVFGVGVMGSKANWTFDIRMAQRDVDVRTGIEWIVKPDAIYLRGGFRLEGLALGTNFTVGAGYHLTPSTRLDYAYWLPVGSVLETLGGHRFSVQYHF